MVQSEDIHSGVRAREWPRIALTFCGHMDTSSTTAPVALHCTRMALLPTSLKKATENYCMRRKRRKVAVRPSYKSQSEIRHCVAPAMLEPLITGVMIHSQLKDLQSSSLQLALGGLRCDGYGFLVCFCSCCAVLLGLGARICAREVWGGLGVRLSACSVYHGGAFSKTFDRPDIFASSGSARRLCEYHTGAILRMLIGHDFRRLGEIWCRAVLLPSSGLYVR